jgi:hypothetical protein
MNGMEKFEHELRESFRRVEPPQGLERRILERAGVSRRRGRMPRWMAAAASIAIAGGGLLGVMRWHEQQMRLRQAEQVRQQIALTVEITSRTLARAEGRLRSIGVKQIPVQEASWREY